MMHRRLYALGRLKSGQMNKTESKYSQYLETLKRIGEIQAWWFEPIKLRIADNACFYTPDFMVLKSDGVVELHEVKGAAAIFTDDAKVKVKVASSKFPFKIVVVFPQKGGGWKYDVY